MQADHERIRQFQEQVGQYRGKRARSFPWRHHPDPYAVLVSEFMLQQTQTSRVLGYFAPFLARFPDFAALAAAPLADLLAFWQGLGYNRRALWLQQTAQRMVADHGGRIPGSVEALTALPGIGPNTAGAILCFAYDLPVPFLETNIKAALIHDFFPDPGQVSDHDLLELSSLTMDRQHPREWYYALVDYGVEIKKAHPNPSRKARSYRKQAGFQGSLRQFRGSILRQLLRQGAVDREGLYRAVCRELDRPDPEALELYGQALRDLVKEGLVAEESGRYLPGSGPSDQP